MALGDQVAQGQLLLIVEAMKMEHSIIAPHDGEIAELHADIGDFVQADMPLVVFV